MHTRMMTLIYLVLVFPFAGAAGDIRAQVRGRGTSSNNPPAVKRDLRVEGALAELGVEYTLTTKGSFGVSVNYSETHRSQMCYIDSTVEQYLNLEVREVWSRAMRSRSPLSSATMNRLLRMKNKFGGWRIVDAEEGGVVLYYSAQVGADADAQTLKSVINMVAAAADLIEAELTGKDEL